MAKESTTSRTAAGDLNDFSELELELLMDSVLIYSPPKVTIKPISSLMDEELLEDGFRLEET